MPPAYLCLGMDYPEKAPSWDAPSGPIAELPVGAAARSVAMPSALAQWCATSVKVLHVPSPFLLILSGWLSLALSGCRFREGFMLCWLSSEHLLMRTLCLFCSVTLLLWRGQHAINMLPPENNKWKTWEWIQPPASLNGTAPNRSKERVYTLAEDRAIQHEATVAPEGLCVQAGARVPATDCFHFLSTKGK